MNPIWILLFTSLYLAIRCVYIEKNGYKGITISFSENSLDDSFDLVKLTDVLKNASNLLFHATRKRSYFEEFLLVVPPRWTENEVCNEFVTEAPKNIDIYVSDSPDIPVLKTQHSKGCGEKGDIIYLPKNWLASSVEDLAFQFIQQWSIFRYGVFPENPERPGSCIATGDSTWSPTGCYNIHADVEVRFDKSGLPVCYFPDGIDLRDDFHSSIMFSGNSTKVLNFCDGSDSFPHNPIAPTLHNRICEGKSVWSVIKNTEDFLYGRNLPLEDKNLPNEPTFRCFRESKTHLTIVVQDSDSEARTEIRYALFYFLSIIEPADFNVSLATFSSDANTVDDDFISINLEDKRDLKSLLDSRVKLNEKLSNPCLTCGLRKAFKVSETSQYPLRTIVLLSRESSIVNSKTTEMTEIIQSNTNATLHLLFLEDTTSDIIPSSLMDTVENSNGRILRVKNDPVFMLTELTTALLDASKNTLHVEDKILVVHKKTFVNVTSNIADIFYTPKGVKGTLLYSMQFKKRGDIKNVDDKCSDMDIDLQSPICGSRTNIIDDQSSGNVWKYSFRYIAGSEGTTCSSLALLKLESSSKKSFTVRGWLNDNKITPGQNALVIYGEVYGRLERDAQVEARISGPGLEEFRLELRDNGNGDPDTIKGDNVYSRYFTSFTQKGTYIVSIYVEVLEAVRKNTHTEGSAMVNEMKIVQTKVIGTFRVTQSPPKEDIIPPSRVSDLEITSIDNTNRTVELQWTAPGDDYDYGKAKKYTFKLSNHWMALMDFTFNLKENILLETPELPANSGVTENMSIQCPLINYNETYYIALHVTDNKYNTGKVSNIVQIHFKDAYYPSTDTGEISTETSNNHNLTSTSLILTDVPIENITSTIFTTTTDESISIHPTNETKDGIFIEKTIFIISTSSLGVLILILIILNIVICFCCRKQKPKEPKKLSKKASLRPPYNLNIAYKHGSEAVLDEEHATSNSLSTLVDHSTIYSSSDGRTSEKRYTYHTGKSLKSEMESQNKRNDLGFQLVQAMPAYATSSLSRFVGRQVEMDNEDLSSDTRSNSVQLAKFKNADETHIYPLGQV